MRRSHILFKTFRALGWMGRLVEIVLALRFFGVANLALVAKIQSMMHDIVAEHVSNYNIDMAVILGLHHSHLTIFFVVLQQSYYGSASGIAGSLLKEAA